MKLLKRENITNPGKAPVSGDKVKDIFSGGQVQIYEYHETIEQEQVSPKPVYSSAQFLAKIPKAKIRAIQTAAETNDDINQWLFLLKLTSVVDLNTLPKWFEEGLDAMVVANVFTQQQIDTFLNT